MAFLNPFAVNIMELRWRKVIGLFETSKAAKQACQEHFNATHRHESDEEAFLRYLAPPPLASATTPQTSQGAGFRVADTESRCGNRNSSATPKSASIRRCGGVADTSRGSGSAEIVEEIF